MQLHEVVRMALLPFLMTMQTAISETLRVKVNDDPHASLRVAWIMVTLGVLASSGVAVVLEWRKVQRREKMWPYLYIPLLFLLQTASEHTIIYFLPEGDSRISRVWMLSLVTVAIGFIVVLSALNIYYIHRGRARRTRRLARSITRASMYFSKRSPSLERDGEVLTPREAFVVHVTPASPVTRFGEDDGI